MNPFKVADQRAQSAIDAIAFWLMHLGVPRSWQVYVLTAAYVVTSTGSTWLQYQSGDTGLPSIVVTGACAALLVTFAEMTRRQDEAAEKRGLRGTDALVFDSWVDPFKCVAIFLAVLTVREDGTIASCILGELAHLSFLLRLYLMRTPPRPPPRRQHAPSLVPVEVAR